jgi:hypothetical protein
MAVKSDTPEAYLQLLAANPRDKSVTGTESNAQRMADDTPRYRKVE